jgi:hypothetical protein
MQGADDPDPEAGEGKDLLLPEQSQSNTGTPALVKVYWIWFGAFCVSGICLFLLEIGPHAKNSQDFSITYSGICGPEKISQIQMCYGWTGFGTCEYLGPLYAFFIFVSIVLLVIVVLYMTNMACLEGRRASNPQLTRIQVQDSVKKAVVLLVVANCLVLVADGDWVPKCANPWIEKNGGSFTWWPKLIHVSPITTFAYFIFELVKECKDY